jgi:RNA polymerase sigma factor (TIGR02999 family)
MPASTAIPLDATVLMVAAAQGDSAAANQLLPLVYGQLRRVAQLQLASERSGNSLSATELVHEAFIRISGRRELPWACQAHYYAAAAQSMRWILVDHARARAAGIRGGPEARRAAVALNALPDLTCRTQSAGFLILDEAITRLERVDEEAATVVRLRYLAGLSIEQTAAATGVSSATVKRAWAFARGWLKEAIEAGRV